jgi:hypothetical protein
VGILIGIIAALLLSVAVFVANTSKAVPPAESAPTAGKRVVSSSAADYQQRLEKLAASEPPKELSLGAMCYKPAMPPDRFDYVCPTCKTKTVLANPKRSRSSRELDACRRQLKRIKGLKAELIETGFCAICFPKAKAPSLDLLIHNADGTSHRVNGISSNDLLLTTEFLTGETKHKGNQGRETPLQDHLPRLRQLLGLPKEAR